MNIAARECPCCNQPHLNPWQNAQQPMSLHELLARLDGKLTAADHRLAQVLLASPRETAFLSASEVARRAGVNAATAVRFARKLGCAGYPELRGLLRQELFGASDAASRMRERMRKLAGRSVLKTFVETEIANLARLSEQVSDADLRAAARAVRRAGQVCLYAVGHAAALACLLDSRLGRAGCRTRILSPVARDMAADLAQLRRHDVLVLFALNAVPPLMPKIVAQARAAGAVCVLITDIPAPPLKPAPQIVLAAGRGLVGEPRSLAVPMTLCNALVLHLSRLDPQRTLSSLEKLDRVRRQLGETS